MSNDCENCQKKDACAKRYYEGNQQNCIDKQQAYQSLENYIKWLAKGDKYDNI